MKEPCSGGWGCSLKGRSWATFRWLDPTLPCPDKGADPVDAELGILVFLDIMPGNPILVVLITPVLVAYLWPWSQPEKP